MSTPSPTPYSPDVEKQEPDHGSALSDVQATNTQEPSQDSEKNLWISDPRFYRPMSMFLGPLPLLIFCWIFFGVTWANPLPLPDYLARKVHDHYQSSTMIVAVVATILACWSSYFFSLAVRYLMTIRLATKYSSLHVVSSMTRIAQRSMWFGSPKLKWFWLIALSWITISLQTSALTSFLNVGEIRVSTPVVGSEMNMGNNQLLQLASQTRGFPDAVDIAASYFLQSAMITALQFQREITTIFNFNGHSYSSRTGGIKPASFVQETSVNLADSDTSVVPPTLQDVRGANHNGLPFNKTITIRQQGFSADVDCRRNDPQDLSRYQGSYVGGQLQGQGINVAQLSVNCPGTGITTSPRPVALLNSTVSDNIGALFAVRCAIPGTNQHDIIIRAAQAFERFLNQTVCTVTPKVTQVDVTYSNTIDNLNLFTAVNVSEPVASVDIPIWGAFALDMLIFNILLGQSTIGSTIGNAWLLSNGAGGNITLMDAMNTYIRAAMEFSGTVLRYLYAQQDSRFIQGGFDSHPQAEAMSTPITGTFYATTFGWQQDHDVAPLFLIPTTVTIGITYILLAYAVFLAHKHRKAFGVDDADFDPTDFVHVVAAHSPETRRERFRRFGDGVLAYTTRTSVKLGMNDEGVRGLEVKPRDGNKTMRGAGNGMLAGSSGSGPRS